VYMNLAPVMKPAEKNERSLRLYPRVNFAELYHTFDEAKIKPFELPFIRREWKNVIQTLHEINKDVWEIATYRRNTREWNKRRISVLHTIIFNLSLKIRDLHETLLAIITEEEIIWRNYILNLYAVAKERKSIALGKEESYELNPTARISTVKLTLRQIFTPVQNLLDAIESELLSGNVDEAKLRQFEDAMLLRILPWFYKVFKKTIEAGGGRK